MEKFKKENKKSGFSIVETLVAIFILSLVITAAMTVAQGSLQASFYARDRILATFLAQEAIELVKNRRDKNGLSESPWLAGLGACASSVGCALSPRNFGLVSGCDQNGEKICNLCRDTNDGDILVPCDGRSGLEESGLTRSLKLRYIPDEDSANEAEITATVTWANKARKVVITEHIFNWHPFSALEE